MQVVNLIKPIACVKKLSVSLILSPDLPLYAIGDENKLLQTILNIVGNAVKFTKEGSVRIFVSAPKLKYIRDWELSEAAFCNGQFYYLQAQVENSIFLLIGEISVFLFSFIACLVIDAHAN